MTRKLVSLLLCLAMMLSLAPLATAETLEMSDIPGMTAPGVFPIVTEPVTLTIALIPQANVLDYDTNEFTLWIEEKTGINIEFVYLPTDSAEAKQKVDLMIAANETLPDIILQQVSDVDYYGTSGVLVNMKEYFGKYSYYFDKAVNEHATQAEKNIINTEMYATDGGVYGFPFYLSSAGNNNENIFYINQEWLDTLGLKMPTTTDELYDVLVAFRDNDPNGNGKKDEIPLMGYGSGYGAMKLRGDVVGNLLNAFLYYPYANNARLVVKDGVVSSSLTDEALREGLRYCKKLYDEGLISELSFTQDPSQLKAIIDLPSEEDTLVGMVATHALSGSCGWGGASEANDKVLEYTYMAPLIGPKGVQYAAQNLSGLDFNVVITKYCKNPEVAFRFLDAFCNPEIGITYRRGQLGRDWTYCTDGELTAFGKPALYKTANADNIWSAESQNVMWRNETLRMALEKWDIANVLTGDKYTDYRSAMFSGGIAARLGFQPAEQIFNPKYNAEEKEIADEYNPMIWETSNEWRTMFIMGEKDLDADWQAYLDTLESLGLNEVIEVTQSWYDRTKAN